MPVFIPPDGEYVGEPDIVLGEAQLAQAADAWAAVAQAQMYGNPLAKKTAKMPPKSTLPPLELNLAAKKPSPWTALANLEEFYAARKEGKHIRYQLGHTEYDPMDIITPSRKHPLGTLKKYFACGIMAHNTERVYVHIPVKTNGLIWVWMGKCREDYDLLLAQGVFQAVPYGEMDYGIVNDGEKVKGVYV